MTNQERQVLNFLKEHGEITSRIAAVDLGIISLPPRIMKLRRAGYSIPRVYRTSPTTHKRYGVYLFQGGGSACQ